MSDYGDYRERSASNRLAPAFYQPNEDALPPQNTDVEEALLAAMMLDDSCIEGVFGIIGPEDFYRETHQIFARAMQRMHAEGQAVDSVTVADYMIRTGVYDAAGGDEAIARFCGTLPNARTLLGRTDLSDSRNWAEYARIIKEKSKARVAIEIANDLIRRAYQQHEIPDDVLDRASQMIEAVRADRPAKDEAPEFTTLPEPMSKAAFRGLVGEIVDVIATQTEACKEAILMQFLVAFGSAAGPRPHWIIDASRHCCNLFTCMVGPSGIARKGTSWDIAHWLLAKADPSWGRQPIFAGMTSGEGLIFHAKDEGGTILAVESEFARTLTNMGRDNCNLSAVLRQAWDGPRLRVLTRNNPVACDNAYISVIAHITMSDLKAKLRQNDVENGMVNRFLWCYVYRAQLLPRGGDFHGAANALGPLISDVTFALEFARHDSGLDVPFRRTPEAERYWDELYMGPLSAPRTGDYAKATVRAAPLIMRLAILYALLDREFYVAPKHIESARAVWDYCDATAAFIFGDRPVDRDGVKVIHKLRDLLKEAKAGGQGNSRPDGLLKTEINRKIFGGHKAPEELDRILAALHESSLIRPFEEVRAGKVCTVWRAVL